MPIWPKRLMNNVNICFIATRRQLIESFGDQGHQLFQVTARSRRERQSMLDVMMIGERANAIEVHPRALRGVDFISGEYYSARAMHVNATRQVVQPAAQRATCRREIVVDCVEDNRHLRVPKIAVSHRVNLLRRRVEYADLLETLSRRIRKDKGSTDL